jgi:hypothetical protein
MIVLRQRQLLMRVLKLWIVVDDRNMYDLIEERPLMIEADYSLTKIVAQNGYHSSKPLYIKKNNDQPICIEVGCKANNTKLWVSLLLSFLLFATFVITHFAVFLVLANVPFLFLMYCFFFKHEEFITIGVMDLEKKKRKQ